MKIRRLSLTAKVNIVIVALVLLNSALLFASSESAYQRAVFEPCMKKLERVDDGIQNVERYLPSLKHYMGTEDLNAAVAQTPETRTALRTWMAQQPSMDEDPNTATFLEDYERFFTLLDYLRVRHDVDTAFALIEKGGKSYTVGLSDRRYQGDTLELFGIEENFLPPEDFTVPGIFRDGSTYYYLRCMQLDLGGGDRLNIWAMLDMTDELEGHTQFILRSVLFIIGVTVLASVVSILLMRHFVTRPIRNLARAAAGFTPEEDGTYSREKVIKADIKSRDEIGDLSLDIRAMQEGIVDNTQKLALMTAEKERVKTELEMATMIQATALPSDFPAFPDRTDFSVYATMTPAKEVGGDFYDFFLIDETHLGIVMADVSDKGVPAALFMMTARTLVQIYAKMKQSPSTALQETNKWLSEKNKSKMFFTVWLGILDLSTGIISAVNAGHEYPALKLGHKPFELFRDKHGFVAGVMAKARYTEYEIRLSPGDRLFLYTDGVPEAQKEDGSMFGLDRMIEALNREPGAPLEALLSNVHGAVDSFIDGAKQFDDLTMLCLEYKGPRDAEGQTAPRDEQKTATAEA